MHGFLSIRISPVCFVVKDIYGGHVVLRMVEQLPALSVVVAEKFAR